MKTLRYLVLAMLCAFALALSAPSVHAAGTNDARCTSGTFCPLADVSGATRVQDLYGSPDLATFLNRLFTASLSVGAILAVLRLGYAGYQYMVSDNWGDKHHAREIISDVVIGLLLLLSCWLILNQINPDILSLKVLNDLGDASKKTPSQTAGTPQ